MLGARRRVTVFCRSMDLGSYCREVESYLCNKNSGHLVRIVGPGFELVCDWAERRIPLHVVFRSIDRTFERHYRKGRSRRPLRIEFCEADVVELFDEWCRAVGPGALSETPSESQVSQSLVEAHIERTISRLITWRDTDGQLPAMLEVITRSIADLNLVRERTRITQGAARQEVVDRLRQIEIELTAVLHEVVDSGTFESIQSEMAIELESFRQRMPPEAFATAKRVGIDRLLYDHFKLPKISFE